jgi:hypothetical protein
MKFISQPVDVTEASSPRRPDKFVWGGVEYKVEEVIAQWQDWNFSAGAPTKDWRSRRHRNCFHVRTTDGSEFEMYLDRGTKLVGGKWYLHSKIK